MTVLRLVIAPPLLGVFVAAAVLAGLSAPVPPTHFCTTDSKDAALKCMCLSYHPDFCSEEGPIPSRCRASEDGTKANGGCHCCKTGKAATIEERGTYQHIR